MKLSNIRAAARLTGIVGLVFLINVTGFAQVRSWGNNDDSVLGQGGGNHQATPQLIANSADITALSSGRFHTLGMKADGTVLSWGGGQYGRLCDNTETGRETPAVIPGLTNVAAVVANHRNSLFLLGDGTLKVCGNNQLGQLANGTANANENALVPQDVPGMSNVVAIAGAGFFFLALKSDGTVWSWGQNELGQLGIGGAHSTSVATPTQVSITGVVSIAAAENNGMAVKSDQTVRVWGYNMNGQLGNGTTYTNNPPCFCETTPTQSQITGVVQIAGGVNYITALTASGNIYSWGANDFGQFGNGTRSNQSALPVLGGVSNAAAIDTGQRFTIARKRDGSVWGWGTNLFGEVGDGTVGGGMPNCNCKVSPVQSLVGTGNAIISVSFNQAFAAMPNPNTPVGNNVLLRGERLNITFGTVTQAGTTTIQQIDAAAVAGNYNLPFGGEILANFIAREISTLALFISAARATVCTSDINAADEAEFNSLQILHGEGANWVNRTVSRNYSRREICASVSSFSPFVIGRGVAPPTAAEVSVSGRVFSAEGRGITNAVITLIEADGTNHRVVTGRRGSYRFEGIEVGQTVIVGARARRFAFTEPSRVINVTDNLTDVDFVADGNTRFDRR